MKGYKAVQCKAGALMYSEFSWQNWNILAAWKLQGQSVSVQSNDKIEALEQAERDTFDEYWDGENGVNRDRSELRMEFDVCQDDVNISPCPVHQQIATYRLACKAFFIDICIDIEACRIINHF